MFQRTFFLLLLLSASAWSKTEPKKSNEWSVIRLPKGEITQAIGGASNGCQSGAMAIPETGEGFYTIRRWRNRFYTQPVTIDLLQNIGRSVAPRKILVGDASLPIGGKMPSDHASHQNGLDVDVWFYTIGANELPPSIFNPIRGDIEHEDPPSMADKLNGLMKTELWRPEYRQALFTASNYPETDRIFVNPIIKQYLCETETDKSWLYKIRPYWGHDAHFHIRLKCPLNNPFCESQKPIPMTDGCDADLQNWINDQAEALRNPKPAKPTSDKKPREKPKHPQCEILLKQ